jgi:hypothetical protein
LGIEQGFCRRFAIDHNIHSGVFAYNTDCRLPSKLLPYFLLHDINPVAIISPIMNHQQPVHIMEESSGDEESDEHSSTETSAKEASTTSSATPVLAHQETKAVNRSKSLVYLVLLIVAAAAATATYFFLAIEEQNDFESEVSYVFLRLSCGSTRY